MTVQEMEDVIAMEDVSTHASVIEMSGMLAVILDGRV
jgi:hypothetical protein